MMDREQHLLIGTHLPQMKDLLRDSNQNLTERRVERENLRKAYDEHVALRKYKHNVKKRLDQQS